MSGWNGQICKVCERDDHFGFTVPDDIWNAVVPLHLRNRVVCLGCFDNFAHEKNISYTIDTIYFAGNQECFTFSCQK